MKLAGSLSALAVTLALAAPAAAEPTDPVVIGWWSYFTPEGAPYKVPTGADPNHQITGFGDPDTYFYEPSGAQGMQGMAPPDQAWATLISFILANTQNASLSSSFTINTGSDLFALTEAYFGWALVLLYVPKDKYCDSYRIHIGTVDDGVEALANTKILGYKTLGGANDYIDMVEYQTNNLVLRPGLNEIVLIHEDQAQVERFINDAYIEHNGVQVPLAPKNIILGQVIDSGSQKPVNESLVSISGNGLNDTFLTGPFGFYFFDGLTDGSYALTADAAGYQIGSANGSVAMGAAMTEVVRTNFPLAQGCSCPSGKVCGPSGGCLDPCKPHGEFGEVCDDPAATCVNHVCVKNPCDTLTCAPGFHCVTGTAGTPPVPVGNCVEVACSNVCCGMGQICSAGACVTDNCGAGCGDGKACAGGNCVDACSVITCASPLVCKGGVCLDPCVADPSSCTNVPDGGFGVGGGVTSSGAMGGGGGAGGAAHGGSGGGTGASGGAGGTKSGCGCRVGDEGEERGGLGVMVAGLMVAAAARRRRARR
jgi:MYXO-CTERM domain-containing protein